MPSRPQRLCRCGQIVPVGQKCPTCTKQSDQARGSARARGYDSRWDEYSRQRRARFPLCVGFPEGVHGDVPVLAQCTDHILDARTHPELFWDPNNHQSMCFDCNKRKAIAQEGGLGR